MENQLPERELLKCKHLSDTSQVHFACWHCPPRISQLVSCSRADQPYTLAAWVAYVSGVDDDRACQIGLTIGDTYVQTKPIPTDRPFFYEKVEGTITVLEKTAFVWIHLYCLNGANVEVLIEDVSFTWDN